jgi:hypothetical protein
VSILGYRAKALPAYDHVAVIVAEEITGRFLNVISLFNGHIPLIAIRMQALAFSDQVSLAFSTVLGEMRLGTDEEDETPEPTDRAHWENRAGRVSLEVLDSDLAHELFAVHPGHHDVQHDHIRLRRPQAFHCLHSVARRYGLESFLRQLQWPEPCSIRALASRGLALKWMGRWLRTSVTGPAA